MSGKYQKPYVIPEGFPALLKAFTREILRSQPDNIYEFGALYFAEKLNGEAAPGPSAGEEKMNLGEMTQTAAKLDIASMSAGDLESVVMRLFLEADADQSGYLDRKEFLAVLSHAELNLNERQIRAVLAEADTNADEVIEYREFLPVMMELLQFIKAREETSSRMAKIESIVRNEVEDMLLHGLSKQELEALMMRVFQKADKDRSGALDTTEFKECLKAAELGLTRKDINLIMSQVDANNDGVITYEEFVPVCFQVLIERFKDEILTSDILSNHEGLQGLLLEAFEAADPDGTGHLSQTAMRSVLQGLSYKVLGLTTLQQISLISQATTTPDGLVQYVPFVPVAAGLIYAMYDIDSMKLRMEAIRECADAGGIASLSGMDIGALRALLEDQFRSVDADGTGQLDLEQVMEILNNLNSLSPESLQLGEVHMRAMFTAIDANEDGTVDWAEFVNFVCDVIEHVEREQFIAGRAEVAAQE